MFRRDDSNKHDDLGVVPEDIHEEAEISPALPPDTSVSPAFTPGPVVSGSDSPAPTALPAPAGAPAIQHGSAKADELIDIKQSALKQLTPLVGHLNQTPEEKFRITMMMIQASDDRSLINEAYTAAQAITDEKTKAQALLDIVNEINYFTQHDNHDD